MNSLKDFLNKFLIDDELKNSLSVLPEVKNNFNDKKDRILSLLNIYNIYIPNSTSVEIYNNLYFSIINSLDRKETREENEIINDSFFNRKKYGIIGGLDSFKITGLPGVGKTATIHRCIDLISGNRLIKISNSKRNVIPFLVVECPADGSFKSLLYSILQQVDFYLGSNYFVLNSGRYITTDYLLNVVSVILINHVGVLIVDEIERVASDTAKGSTLMNYLTQLVNQTNVGVCFVGNESSNLYFSIKEYLSRRTVGVSIKHLEYDEFIEFCTILFRYQYTIDKVEFNSEISQIFYKLTNGVPAIIVGLFVETQKYALVNDIKAISAQLLEEIFNTMFCNMKLHLTNRDEKVATTKTVKNKTKVLNIINQTTETLILDIYKISNKDIDLFLSMLAKKLKVELINET